MASGWLYYWGGDLHRFTQWISAYIALFIGQLGLYLIACYAVLRRPAATGRFESQAVRDATGARGVRVAIVIVVLVFAAGFRAELVGRRPFLSTDTYRYIWDGRVQAAGINPYRYVPAAPELARLRDDEIYPKINRGDYEPTPYPPAAQAIYLGVYLARPLSITAFKVAMSLFDLSAMVLVMLLLVRHKMDPARAVIFAWHPLLVWEGAHSGHVESVFIAFLALALVGWSYRRPEVTGVALALATLVKFYPALLIPVLMFSKHERATGAGWASRLRSMLVSSLNLRMVAAFLVTIVLVYLPYLGVGAEVVGSLPGEFKEEGYTAGGSRYFALELLRTVAPVPALVFTAVAVVVLSSSGLWWMTRRKRDAVEAARGIVAMIGLFLLLTTPRYPWYYAWLLPFLCFVPRAGWIYLTGATVLLYLLWFTPNVYPNLPLWLGIAIYGPTLMLLGREEWKERQKEKGKRSPWTAG